MAVVRKVLNSWIEMSLYIISFIYETVEIIEILLKYSGLSTRKINSLDYIWQRKLHLGNSGWSFIFEEMAGSQFVGAWWQNDIPKSK